MTTCCTTSADKNSGKSVKYSCPVNRKLYAKVSLNTILLHLKSPWLWPVKDQNYYFCDDPDCDVVYFGEDNSVIEQDRLRNPVGIKNHTAKATLCYCFAITYKEAEDDTQLKQFVIDRTQNKDCACKILNPSGQCCLKEFAKI